MRELIGHTGDVNDCALSSDGKTAVSCSDDKTVRVWDAKTGSSRVFTGHEATVRGVAITAGGDCVASCSDDCTVGLWRKNAACAWEDGRILTDQDGTAAAAAGELPPHGPREGGGEREGGEGVHAQSHDDEVNDCQFSHDGRVCVSCCASRYGPCQTVCACIAVNYCGPLSLSASMVCCS